MEALKDVLPDFVPPIPKQSTNISILTSLMWLITQGHHTKLEIVGSFLDTKFYCPFSYIWRLGAITINVFFIASSPVSGNGGSLQQQGIWEAGILWGGAYQSLSIMDSRLSS